MKELWKYFFALVLGLLSLQASSLAQTDTTYTDPAGLYTVQVPTNWKLEPKEGFVFLTDPDSQIKSYVLVVESNNVEEGIAAAWQKVSPGFELKVRETTKPPTTQVEAAAQLVYDTPRERIVVGYGQLYQGKVYVFLLDTPLEAYIKRQAQIGIVASSFDISAIKKTDISAVMPKGFDQDITTDLEQYIPQAMQKMGIPGAVIAVVQNGQMVYLKAFGVKELGQPERLNIHTQMMIGSTGKSLTTLMMATLVDDGKMTWDTPVVEILPSFKVADPQITKDIQIHDLVCACTGVPRRDFEMILNANSLSAEGIVDSLKDFQFFTKFGEAFQYSNQMVAAGGYIAAVAGGAQPDNLLVGYASQLQQRVLSPIGMNQTTISFDQVMDDGDYATPHGLDLLKQGYKPIPLDYERVLRSVIPAGGHWSTAPDLARYLITLINKGVDPSGKRVVSEENLEATWKPQVKINADTSYGLGWMISQYRGIRVISHAGNTMGFTSDLEFMPEKGLGMVVLTNAQGSNLFNQTIAGRVVELLFDQAVEDDERDFEFALEQTAKAYKQATDTLQGTIDPAVMAPYLGNFHHPALGGLRMTLEGNKLFADVGEFKVELRRRVDKDGHVGYMAIDPPLLGLVLELSENAGQPIISMFSPPDNYRFSKE